MRYPFWLLLTLALCSCLSPIIDGPKITEDQTAMLKKGFSAYAEDLGCESRHECVKKSSASARRRRRFCVGRTSAEAQRAKAGFKVPQASAHGAPSLREDVLRLFGQPKAIVPRENGYESFVYEEVRERQRRPRIFTPATLIERDVKRLTVDLNAQGRVFDFRVERIYEEQPKNKVN